MCPACDAVHDFMNILLLGRGKTGSLVADVARQRGHEIQVAGAAENSCGQALATEKLSGIDVVIDFTTPSCVVSNIEGSIRAGKTMVVGTTGWFEQISVVREAVVHAKTGLVWAANFSVGVNLFLQTVAQAAARFAKHPEYEAWGWEIHHSAKKDAPSGTLKKLAEEMRAAGYTRPVSLSSNRAGAIPGTHEIGFDSVADSITFRHTAHSREGFARGALQAARWVAGKKGFYEFKEILAELS